MQLAEQYPNITGVFLDDISYPVRSREDKAEAMAEVLKERFGLPVVLWDERRTTIDAHNILMAGGKNAKQRKKTVDAVAAALMLEGFLTRRKLEGTR